MWISHNRRCWERWHIFLPLKSAAELTRIGIFGYFNLILSYFYFYFILFFLFVSFPLFPLSHWIPLSPICFLSVSPSSSCSSSSLSFSSSSYSSPLFSLSLPQISLISFPSLYSLSPLRFLIAPFSSPSQPPLLLSFSDHPFTRLPAAPPPLFSLTSSLPHTLSFPPSESSPLKLWRQIERQVGPDARHVEEEQWSSPFIFSSSSSPKRRHSSRLTSLLADPQQTHHNLP